MASWAQRPPNPVKVASQIGPGSRYQRSQLPYSVNHVTGKIGKLCVRSYLVTRIYIHQKVRSSPCFRAQMYLGDYVETWLILLTLRSLATSDRDRQAFFPDQLVQVVGLLL